MKSMMKRNTFREIKKSFGRYFAILAIIALGVALFSGLKITQSVMVHSADVYLKDLQFYDYRLVSTLGFTEENVEALAEKEDVVMDGRDIGTTVLPDAFCKIYLTASVDARAKRRYDELAQKGEKCDYDIIKKDIEQRDYQDMHREISPLKQADDAVLVDTSDMNIEQVVECIENIINERK